MWLERKNKQALERKPRLFERLFRRFVFKYYARNFVVGLQLQAKRQNLDCINENMMHGMHFRSRWDLLRYGLTQSPAEGLVVEFGVYEGDSIRAIGEWAGRPVHGFDSFEGLPADWTGTTETAGKFNAKGKLPRVPGNVTQRAGWFGDTLPPSLARHEGLLAFAKIDCDLYSSTKTVFDALAPRIGAGTLLAFDEYFNYHNWQQHEFKAFQEFVQANDVRYQYLGFTQSGGSVLLRVPETGTDPRLVSPPV
jgi:hypothetical protein